MKRPKYGNSKVINSYGKFDSSIEWSRFLFLLNKEKKGEISGLKRQVEFPLLPAQYRTVIRHLKTKDKEEQKLVERPCTYVADFVYERDGELVVEDVKGASFLVTADFKIKKKMMLYFHNIEVKIITSPTFWVGNESKVKLNLEKKNI